MTRSTLWNKRQLATRRKTRRREENGVQETVYDKATDQPGNSACIERPVEALHSRISRCAGSRKSCSQLQQRLELGVQQVVIRLLRTEAFIQPRRSTRKSPQKTDEQRDKSFSRPGQPPLSRLANAMSRTPPQARRKARTVPDAEFIATLPTKIRVHSRSSHICPAL